MADDTAERSRAINAAPADVWAVLGDVRRMPEWSQELESVDVLDGDGRSAGSRFRGNNRDGDRTWSMSCVIDAYEPEQRLEFHTEDKDGAPRTRWWYRVEPSGDGAVVTEGFTRVAKLNWLQRAAERKVLGDRAEHNARNIDESLARLAGLVEQWSAGEGPR